LPGRFDAMRARLVLGLMAIERLRRVALVGVLVAVAGCGAPESDPDDVDLHAPATDAERAAARVAVEFATRLQRGQARAACDLARGAARRMLRCSRVPRIPGWSRIPPRQRLEVVDVRPAEVPRAIRLGIPVPAGPLLAVEVDPSGGVVSVGSYGFA
jgi:hypothetical protein